MEKVKKTGEGILFGGMIFLLFLVVFESFLEIPAWLSVAGRLHPMLLHFPIVLLLIAFFSIWIPVKNETDHSWLNLLRLIAALSAVFTAIFGMLLSQEEPEEGSLLLLHKIGGIMIAILGYLFYSYYPFLIRHAKISKPFTLIASIVIIVTGHWGANLTHGEDYVLAPIKSNQRTLVAPEKAVIFSDVILPILENKCTNCHGKSKQKGELLLDNLEAVLSGGKSGPLFIPGQPDTSLLITRLHLPTDHKKHMPPASRPQLTEAEEAILYAWIRSGATTDSLLFSLPEQDTFRILATQYLQPAGPSVPVYDFKPADEKKITALNNNYRIIVPLGKNSPALSVNFYGRTVYTSKALEDLLPIKQQIVELNLSHLPVKDGDLKLIQQFSNLEKLNLNYTDITAEGAEQLGTLNKLKELALSGTAITASTLEKILPVPELKSLFVWDTSVDPTQLQTLRNKFTGIHIETGYMDKGDVVVALSPPNIKTPQGIFNNNTRIEIFHPFKEAEIRYTTDGMDPDSITGKIYSQPIAIDHSATLKARAYKKGWYGSATAQATYIRREYVPDSIAFITAPDPKYNAESPGLLKDGDLGNYTNLSNGEWLGYRNNEAAFYLFFQEKIQPRNIILQMAQNLRGHIFPAASIEVWGGTSQHDLKLLGKHNNSLPAKDEPAKSLLETIPLPKTELQCIKLIIKPVSKLPEWHASKGNPAWAFLSEVVIN